MHLDCFHSLAVVSSDAENIVVHIALAISTMGSNGFYRKGIIINI